MVARAARVSSAGTSSFSAGQLLKVGTTEIGCWLWVLR
jgi:hypothetical protein